MLNLNYNINSALEKGGCIGLLKYNYSASFTAYAGGGAGSDTGAGRPGGGGGAGAAISSSFSVVPNILYTINVGSGSTTSGGKGQNTQFFGFDDNDTKPFTALLEGGFGGSINAGGNSGTGSLTTISGTSTFGGYTGSAAVFTSISGQSFWLAGGGAGRSNNGVAPVPTLKSGDGGAEGGGGGGAARGNEGNAIPGYGNAGGGSGGFDGDADNGTSGGGGGGASNFNGSFGDGGDGVVTIQYSGKPKAIVTGNVTTTYDGATTHTFGPGEGTFQYIVPYPWEEPVTPYQIIVCPPTYTEN
jgi:hypothetical protein